MTDPTTVVVEDDRPDPPPEGDPHGPETPPDLGEGFDPTPVSEDEIATAIRAVGSTVHSLVGHPDVSYHWNFTTEEVRALAPPVTSIVNRHAALRRMATHSPELAAAAVLGRWGLRNARLSAAIREELAEIAEAEAAAEDDQADDTDGTPFGGV